MAPVGDHRAVEPSDPDLHVFAYTVAEKATLHVAVVDALMTATERFLLQLRPAEVARELGHEVDPDEVAAALEALESWGNVTKFCDTAAPARWTSSTPSGSCTR